MTTASRRLAPGDRRRQILDTARQLLDVKHLVEITVDEAARLAGVSPGLVFHYFGSQIGFRRALAEDASRELIARLEPDPVLSHVRQLRGALEAFAAWAQEHPRLYAAVTSNGDQDVREVHDSFLGTVSGWIVQIADDIGVPATPAFTLTVSGWLAFTEKVVQGWLAEPGLTREEIVGLCENSFYLGLQAVIADPAEWLRVETALAAEPHRTGSSPMQIPDRPGGAGPRSSDGSSSSSTPS